jgi:hypothetical protein
MGIYAICMAEKHDDKKIPQYENVWIGDRKNQQQNLIEGHTNSKTDLTRVSQ